MSADLSAQSLQAMYQPDISIEITPIASRTMVDTTNDKILAFCQENRTMFTCMLGTSTVCVSFLASILLSIHYNTPLPVLPGIVVMGIGFGFCTMSFERM